MSFVFNIAKGRTVELHTRVNDNDPANSALILVVLAETGIESEDVLQDYDTLSALLAGASNEVTNVGYARKTLTDVEIAAPTVDDTNNWVVITFSTQTWTTISAGDSWRTLLVCYDSDTTAGTDANIVPMYGIDLFIDGAATIPNGDDIVVALPNGYAIAR
jgi:hypothetical protein